MALSSCFAYPQFTTKIDCRSLMHRYHRRTGLDPMIALNRVMGSETFVHHVPKLGAQVQHDRSFLGGFRIAVRPKADKCILSRKSSGVCYSYNVNNLLSVTFSQLVAMTLGVYLPLIACLSQRLLLYYITDWQYLQKSYQHLCVHIKPGMTNPQIASSVFTIGTAAVLPYYTLMVAAPKRELTKKAMRSSLPYVVLGLLYAYLLWLSWTPDTMRLMFASKYWLPELQGIARMFSSEMTLASAWIHLLVVDLFAARHVYHDGLANEVETRHSVALCLLFCPIGILSHVITKSMTSNAEKTAHNKDTIV